MSGVKGAAMGFLDSIGEPTAKGAAVGFLDMLDDEDVAKLQMSKEEEESWLRASIKALHTNAALLENLVTCMQGANEAWDYYVGSLAVMFRDVDQSDALVRFWIDSEVRNAGRIATLFREDSVRIQGVRHHLLNCIKPWVRTVKGVKLMSLEPNGRCVHLHNDNKCGIYEMRPDNCRWFPVGTEPCLIARREEHGWVDGAVKAD